LTGIAVPEDGITANQMQTLTDKNITAKKNTLARGKELWRHARVIVSLMFGLFLLWLVSRGQDFELILKEFRTANYVWIVFAGIAAVLSHVVRAMRWNLLVRAMGFHSSTSQTFGALMSGYLSNLAVPRLGEITRCILLGRMSRAPFNSLVGTVVTERVFDMFTLIGLSMLTIAFQFDFLKSFLNRLFFIPLLQKSQENLTLLLFAGLAGLLLLIIAFFFFRKKFAETAHGGFYHRVKTQLSGLKGGMLTILKVRNKSLFIGYSLLIWFLYFLTVYFCFFAIGGTSQLSAAAGMTVLVVGSLGIVAPVPGGIGTYHFMTITTLTELYGIAPEPAISYAYISHATQTLVILFAGGISWVIISLLLKKEKASNPR
jgi:glycosyltransferase 2 family protein